MNTGINESKTLTTHISCKSKYKLYGRKCNSNQKWNSDKCWCKYKNSEKYRACKKYYIWNPASLSCKMVNI